MQRNYFSIYVQQLGPLTMQTFQTALLCNVYTENHSNFLTPKIFEVDLLG